MCALKILLGGTFVHVQNHVNNDNCVENASNDATYWRVQFDFKMVKVSANSSIFVNLL